MSDQILSDYDIWIKNDDTSSNEYEYTDTDLVYLQTIAELYTIGFNSDEVTTYLQLNEYSQQTTTQQIRLLTLKRNEKLADIHQCEDQVAAIDYLRLQLNEGKQYGHNREK
ncbi:hypothetical protein [Companilactobacillus keshanensis]|uniref:hypothetical protein n=1 Tax=Companilactobacillus keshanensis TaxID=2486003 RepID=UPI001CDBC49A|nr:hypothetical protein [Companilactobacillus keshanensis]